MTQTSTYNQAQGNPATNSLAVAFDEVINLSWHILARLNEPEASLRDIQYLYSVRGQKLERLTESLDEKSVQMSRKQGDYASIVDRLTTLSDLDARILHKLRSRKDDIETELGYLYSNYRTEESYRAAERVPGTANSNLRILG